MGENHLQEGGQRKKGREKGRVRERGRERKGRDFAKAYKLTVD